VLPSGFWRRPGFIFSLLLVVAFLGIGLAGSAEMISTALVSNAMDMMLMIGIALAMAVIMSYAGYVSFGHSVFLGVGSFSSALVFSYLYRDEIMPYVAEHGAITTGQLVKYLVIAVVIASLLAMIIAGLVGSVVLRLRGAFFAIATIGLNYVVMYLVSLTIDVFDISENTDEILNPNIGVSTITKYWVFFAFFLISIAIAYIVRVSRLGYGLAAIREDEDAAEVLGIDTSKYKVYAYVLAALIGALWGTAMELRYNHYTMGDFSLLYSVKMIIMVTLGGIGTFIGPIIGAMIYYVLEWTLIVKAGQLIFLILGIIVVIIVAVFPDGIMGLLKKRPSLRRLVE